MSTVFVNVAMSLDGDMVGSGRRLFDNLREPGRQFRIDNALNGPAATHLRCVRQQRLDTVRASSALEK